MPERALWLDGGEQIAFGCGDAEVGVGCVMIPLDHGEGDDGVAEHGRARGAGDGADDGVGVWRVFGWADGRAGVGLPFAIGGCVVVDGAEGDECLLGMAERLHACDDLLAEVAAFGE